MSETPERTALMQLYATNEAAGLPTYLDQLYPKYLQDRLYMRTADSCPNGGPGIRYGHWDSDGIEQVRVIDWGTPLTPAPTALYRLRDQHKQLLYVGITDDLEHRWTSHAATKPWWPEVATRSIEWRPTRAHALAAEAEAIRTEKPLHNIQHNGRQRTKSAR
ncbi:GIY-YIG nuclease family protein [Streptomyces sp. NPDC051658]|uniref:GIY-YIG nuclease family protein n=1 Tax=Streptomyces sp. NPDC051658 TaxID=3365667 RepID=UPI0037B3A8E3